VVVHKVKNENVTPAQIAEISSADETVVAYQLYSNSFHKVSLVIAAIVLIILVLALVLIMFRHSIS